MKLPEINISLHPKQGIALNSPATEILYGGAAGGGKSYLMRVAAIIWCQQIPHLQVYLFRRLSPDLLKTHIEGPQGLRSLLHPWEEAGLVQTVQDEIRFWNGSKIFLCHCQDEKDKYKYLGPEFHVLLIDELTQFTESIYRFLRSRVRMPIGMDVPENLQGRFPRILCASNPGNLGHVWVKTTFIEPEVPYQIWSASDSEGGFFRQFIPARLEDNPSLNQDMYRKALRGLGSPELIRALELGDWDIVEGAFFPEFSTVKHVIEPFPIPDSWPRYRSFDFGSAKPFSVGWWALSDGEPVQCYDPEINAVIQKVYPKDALICYREWYGACGPDKGLDYDAKTIARGILDREVKGEKFVGSVADPSIFKAEGGESIAEAMAKTGVRFKKGDRERIPGWNSVRQRLVGEDGKPFIYWFKTCRDSIKLIPAAQHDEKLPDDLDTAGEDHICDQIRYICMARPFRLPSTHRDVEKTIHNLTLNDLWKYRETKMSRRGRRKWSR